MVAQRNERASSPSLRDVSRNPGNADKAKSGNEARDKKILDRLLDGAKEDQVAKEFSLSRPRISQIANTPAAVAYMAGKGHAGKALNYGMAMGIVRRRLQLIIASGDAIDFDSLVKLVKALEPKQDYDPNAYEMLYAEAERMADEFNLSPQARGKVLQFVKETMGDSGTR